MHLFIEEFVLAHSSSVGCTVRDIHTGFTGGWSYDISFIARIRKRKTKIDILLHDVHLV